MPTIVIHMRQGRTAEQKRELARVITSACVDILGSRPERVNILVHELADENVLKGGEVPRKEGRE